VNRDSHQRPLLIQHYERYLVDQNLDTYAGIVSSSYTVGSLERIVAAGDPTARRGAIIALGQLADYHSNTTLGRALTDRDRGVRMLAEHNIRHLWTRVGTPAQRRHLVAVTEQLEKKDFERATQLATAVVQDAPWIAEAWYNRGKAYFQMGQYEAATRDCHQALEINAYHFLAASIMGQAYLKRNDPVTALDSFRRALRLNPSMEEIRAQVIHLQRSLKGE